VIRKDTGNPGLIQMKNGKRQVYRKMISLNKSVAVEMQETE
jgi:hypothetical protein